MKSTVSHSTAHYLVAIANLLSEQGYARAVDIADKLNISRAAAHLGLKSLKERGFIVEDENRFYSLTAEASALAKHLKGTHTVVETFFTEVLNLKDKEAHENACAIDHHLTMSAARRMLGFMKFIMNHPEGERLLKQFHRARDLCPHEGQCEFCKSFEKCPLGAFMPVEE